MEIGTRVKELVYIKFFGNHDKIQCIINFKNYTFQYFLYLRVVDNRKKNTVNFFLQ
jgi:hypothetical protein